MSEHQGTFFWHEITTPDPKAAQSFYTDLIGWGTSEMDMGEGGKYTLIQNGENQIGGFVQSENGSPPHWLTYIGVDDVDAVVAKAYELGGTVKTPPTDTPPGRLAVIADPSGAVFAVFKPAG